MEKQATTASRILVPVDGSRLAEHAIPYALRLGGSHTALHLVRVVPHPEAIRTFWGSVAVTEAEMKAMSAEDAASDLNRAAKLVPNGIRVKREIVTGDPADQIIQTAIRSAARLVVMASHGRGAVGRWTFGSVADRVARESLVPVMIVCPSSDHNGEPFINRVVVPLDGSELAAHALPAARDIAHQLRIPIHLVQCISPTSARYSTIEMRMPIANDAHRSLIHNEWDQAVQALETTASKLRAAGIDVTTQLPIGPTVTGIEAALEPGDIVVITSHGRGGIRRWLLGSVAERLIRDGVAPVVLVPSVERRFIPQPEMQETFAFAGSLGSSD